MTKATLLIVEDNVDTCQTLAENFRKLGHRVFTANTGGAAQGILKSELVDLMLLDLRLPDISGLRVLEHVKEVDPDVLVIIITANTDAQPAVEAMKAGAYDYLMKPFELDEVKMVVAKALETQGLKREVSRLKRQQNGQFPDTELFGNSAAMRDVKHLIQMVSGTPRTSVLIQGESGTGKELVANSIHNWSSRREKPLVKINCGAIPETLQESELFGHERGAYTDAKTMKKGMFELANGGTIFLDEIPSMQPSLQPKLLRVLETQSFRRIGGTADIQIDVRLIAATNRDLQAMVRAGIFREDLYFRLNVMVIKTPPLRDRREDILPLALLFIEKDNREFNKSVRNINEEAQNLLVNYEWPGNVREVKNVIERGVILCPGPTLTAEHLPQELRCGGAGYLDPGDGPSGPGGGPSNNGDSMEAMEKAHIQRMLIKYNNNKTKTAQALGISRSTLREKMKQYGLDT